MQIPLQKLGRRDYLLIVVCSCLAAISLWIAVRYFYRVFPEASIEFNVNRDSSLPVAVGFLERLRGAPGGEKPISLLPDLRLYRHAALFDYDATAKTFLEREMGLEKANRLMGREIRLWRWRHRWFRPQQKEEIQVDVSPLGDIARFAHMVGETAEGSNLSQGEAQSLAEAFLQQTLKIELSSLEFVEVNTEKREKRTDHLFRWKSKLLQWGDAQYRYSVTIQGAEVGGYEEGLKVPEEWSRGYQKLRSLNDTTAEIAVIFLVATILAMLVVLVRNLRHRDIPWRFAGLLGLVTFVLTFLSQLNNLPLSEFFFDTTDTYGSFLIQLFLRALAAGGGSGAGIFLIAACAEPLYRQSYPHRIALPSLFRWPGLRSKEFFIGTIIGLAMTFFFFAYDSVFYLVAQRFGAWAPAEVPYSDLLNTRIPWVYVLLFGFFPAVSEEFISRVFSLPFFERLFRFRWVAVFLASFIWGFAHANYPNQPFYIRGIEVGIGGLIVSWVFLRFGIVGPLVWHYSVDAFYTAFLLLRSGNLYLTVSGAVSAGIMLIPLLVALGAYLKRRGFVDPTPLLNGYSDPTADRPLAVAAVEERTLASYVPLPGKHRLILASAAILLLVVCLLPFTRFGDFLNIGINRARAIKDAENFLDQRGVDWRSFRTVAHYEHSLDPVAAQYLLKYSGVDSLNRIFSQRIKASAWVVRFYRPLEEEEYQVYLQPRNGAVFTFSHKLAENAPGAHLDKSEAQRLAEKYVKTQGIALDQLELKEANSEKRKSRQDYAFVWEMKAERIRESSVRLEVLLAGDQVTGYSFFVKVPEEWQRAREKTTLFQILVLSSRFLVLGFLGGWAFWAFLRNARRGLIRWKAVLAVSLGLVLVQILVQLNALPVLFRSYDTSVAPRIFVVEYLSQFLTAQILQWLFFTLLIGLASSLYPDCWRLLNRRSRSPYAREALWIAGSLAVAAFGVASLESWFIQRFHQYALLPSLPLLDEVNHVVPALSVLARVLQTSIVYSAVLGIFFFVLLHVSEKRGGRLLFLALTLLSLLPMSAVAPGEWIMALGVRLVLLIIVLCLAQFISRNNVLAYLLSIVVLALSRSGVELLWQSSVFLQWNGLLLLVMLGLIALRLVMEAKKHDPEPVSEAL